jgi:hypothetical protein
MVNSAEHPVQFGLGLLARLLSDKTDDPGHAF